MAFDISSIKAKPTTAPKRETTRTKKDLGPNPWLDKTWDQGLWASYNDDQAYSADFKGALEMLPARRGANKGEPIEKVTGDAADAVYLIRDAAKLLGVGVSVRVRKEYDDATGKHIVVRSGYVNVLWYGKTPKVYKKGESDVTSPDGDSPEVE